MDRLTIGGVMPCAWNTGGTRNPAIKLSTQLADFA